MLRVDKLEMIDRFAVRFDTLDVNGVLAEVLEMIDECNICVTQDNRRKIAKIILKERMVCRG